MDDDIVCAATKVAGVAAQAAHWGGLASRISLTKGGDNKVTIKSYKIKLLFTESQTQLAWKHIGCRRFIYNYFLEIQERLYKEENKHLSAFDMIKLLTPLKHDGEHEWLNEVDSSSLVRTCQDLNAAYVNLFAGRARKPRLKSRKKSKTSFPLCDNNSKVWYDGEYMRLPKFGKVSCETDHALPIGRDKKFSNPRVTYVKATGKWILTVGVECENQARELTDKAMGIDLGLKDLAIVSHGGERFVYSNINKSKRVRTLEHKKKHLQRAVSRKYHTHGNWDKTKSIEKYELMVAKIDNRLANIRDNYIHHITHDLAELLPYRITMEDLNVSGMMKNKHLSRAIKDQCFNKFTTCMRYKSEERGIEFLQADRFYPSSKTCSCCGHIKSDLKLKDRVYVCDVCGNTIDRDFNAALNLERYASHQEGLAA
jgi:putative transposase